MTVRHTAYGKKLLLALMLAGVGSCSPWDSWHGDGGSWHGYYYGDVLTSAAAQVSGPYDSAPRCVAAMHARLRGAPTTASFTCARSCRSVNDGSVENCREVAR